MCLCLSDFLYSVFTVNGITIVSSVPVNEKKKSIHKLRNQFKPTRMKFRKEIHSSTCIYRAPCDELSLPLLLHVVHTLARIQTQAFLLLLLRDYVWCLWIVFALQKIPFIFIKLLCSHSPALYAQNTWMLFSIGNHAQLFQHTCQPCAI